MRANSNWKWGPCGALVALLMISGGALADRPEWAGRGNHGDRDEERGQERERHDHERERSDYYRERDRRGTYTQPQVSVQIQMGGYFDDRHRGDVERYYQEQHRGGHCPPGLAKRHNGCMPPGQERRWGVGQPLPRDVAYYPVEPAVQVRLGTPPAGHEFIRVASDILLVAVGTGMVIDAIQDLGARR